MRVRGDEVTWEPDRWEARRGYTTTRWRLPDLTVLSSRERRDISGTRFVELELQTADGRFTFAVFAEVGTRPGRLFERA